MSSSNITDVRIVTVLGIWDSEGGPRQDNLLLFMFTLSLKVVLNMFTVMLCSRSLQKSFIGLSAISLCLADCLFLAGMTTVWLLRNHVRTADFECFTLAHASTIYSALPLPVLLLGILDHFRSHQTTTVKTLTCSIQVLVIWVLSCLYSYFITDTAVIEGWYDRKYQLCTVQESNVVIYFCTGLSLAIICKLLLYCQEASALIKEIYKHLNSLPSVHQSDLPIMSMKAQGSQEEGLIPVKSEVQQTTQPKLLLSLILGFSTNWALFLCLTTVFWLLDFNAPSFVTVNILWVLCVNSLVVGGVFWFRKERSHLYITDTDDICDWKLYWKVSQREPFPQKVYKISTEAKKNILHV